MSNRFEDAFKEAQELIEVGTAPRFTDTSLRSSFNDLIHMRVSVDAMMQAHRLQKLSKIHSR